MVVVAEVDHENHGETSKNGQVSRCCDCCALQMTSEGWSGGVCRSTPNDAWASQVLV